jgi:hypothetical protein
VRIWSLHPKYLDRLGLLACWREALLAQKVIQGETKGYRHHPQLIRFRLCPDPVAAIATYLASLAEESVVRGYHFDRSKIASSRVEYKLPVTHGQILYEWGHLRAKLARRDPLKLTEVSGVETPDCHPLFKIMEGGIEPWEKVSL